MAFSDQEKLALAEKLSLGLLDTAPVAPGGKAWYNELIAWAPIVPPNKIWTNFGDIPGAATPADADANVVALPSLLEKRKQRLTVEATSNNRTFIAYSTYGSKASAMYQNWIQPSFFRTISGDPSAGYIVRLYHGDPDSGGTEITTTYHAATGGYPCWSFNYALGVVKVSTDESDHFRTTFYDVNGLWLVGYRYIGPTGSSGGSSGKTILFTVGDWVLDGSLYRLDLVHNLDKVAIQMEIYDNVFVKTLVHRELKVDNNTARIYVPAAPDLRFAGVASII